MASFSREIRRVRLHYKVGWLDVGEASVGWSLGATVRCEGAIMGSLGGQLLREWDLLRRQTEPVISGHRSGQETTVWAVAGATDAVVMSMVCQTPDEENAAAARPASIFLTARSGEQKVHFGSADVRAIPPWVRDRWLSSRDRKWYPKPPATTSVKLDQPAQPVDLVALRRFDDDSHEIPPAHIDAALRCLRSGGMAVWIDDIPDRFAGRSDFEPVGTDERFRKKVSGATKPPERIEGRHLTLAAKEQVDELVKSHHLLAVNLARRYARSREYADDLEQVALLALVGAAHRYRPDSNAAFTTFATVSVIGEIKRHFRDKTWILRVPRPLKDTYLAVREASETLGHQLGASPTVEQIAAHIGIATDDVLASLEAGDTYFPTSLDTPATDDEHGIEVGADDPRFEAALNRHQLRLALPRLSPIEQLVIKGIFFDGRTQREVAADLGTNQMQISRLMTGALKRMRSSFLTS